MSRDLGFRGRQKIPCLALSGVQEAKRSRISRGIFLRYGPSLSGNAVSRVSMRLPFFPRTQPVTRRSVRPSNSQFSTSTRNNLF
jgi:hypothetical protein